MMIKRKPWSLLLAGVAILLVLLGLIWLTYDAVGGMPFIGAAASPVRLDLTPDEVLERLEPADSFEIVSQDFADALAVPMSSIQVRLSSGGCAACEMKENPDFGFQPIAEIADQIAQSDRTWLIKDDMMCFYLVQKEQWQPKVCSIWP